MLDILSSTTPIYLAIAAGFLAARGGLFDKPEIRALGKFVIHIALPSLLFNALIQRRFDDILNTTYLAAYAAGSLLTDHGVIDGGDMTFEASYAKLCHLAAQNADAQAVAAAFTRNWAGERS